VTPSPRREFLRAALLKQALPFWVLLLFGFVWLAHQPLTSNAQTILVSALLGMLLLIMWNMKRVEEAPTPTARFLLLLAIALAAFISLRYFSWRINYTISYHDPFSLIGAWLLLAAELYALCIYLLGAFVNAWPIRRTPPPLPSDPEQLPTISPLSIFCATRSVFSCAIRSCSWSRPYAILSIPTHWNAICTPTSACPAKTKCFTT